jgi:uncharacterized membrane protein
MPPPEFRSKFAENRPGRFRTHCASNAPQAFGRGIFFAEIHYRNAGSKRREEERFYMARPGNYRPLIYAGVLLGIGLGSVFEGIVFRQIFQLHGFISSMTDLSTMAGMRENIFWGGLFHAASWIVALLGLRLLWRSGRRGDVPWRGKAFAGAFLLGWGLFVCVEGMLFHHVFELHHIVDEAKNPWRTYWDISFLAWGAVFLGVGGEMLRKDYDAFLRKKRQWHSNGKRPLSSVSPGGAVPGDARI